MLHLFALLAEWDNENRSAETSKGKEERAKNGYWNGLLPFGYMSIKYLKETITALKQQQAQEDSNADISDMINILSEGLTKIGDGYGDTDAILHYKNAQGVVVIFNLYSTGIVSYRDIALRINASNYRTSGNRGENLFDADAIRTIIQNRFYLGEVFYQGAWIPGRHPALISKELFDKCQVIREARQHRPLGKPLEQRVYPLSGLAVCSHCNGHLRGEPGKVRYYRDPNRNKGTCHQTMIRADKAEEAVKKYLSNIRLTPELQTKILDLTLMQGRQLEQVKEQRSALQAALERTKQLFKWGDYTEEEFKAESEEIKKQLDALIIPETVDNSRSSFLLDNMSELLKQATEYTVQEKI